jgi:ketosteroid isomerase-like protein
VDTLGTFLDAFNRADFETLRAVLGDDLVAHVTTDDGGDAVVEGPIAYVGSLREMVQRAGATYTVTLTQDPVSIPPDSVLVMLEIRATRGDRRLHNFSGQLFRIRDGLIREIHMVDAKPAESADFWA